MTARNVRASPRFVCLALVCLLLVNTAPLLMAEPAPVAVMAPHESTVRVGDEVTFTGEGSYCLRGNITAYLWDLGDGTRATGVTVTHAYSDTGVYQVVLVVTAEDGSYGTDNGTVTVTHRDPWTWAAGIDSISSDKGSYSIGEPIEATVVVERGPDTLTAVWEGVLLLEAIDGSGDTVHSAYDQVWLPSGGDQQTLRFELSLEYAGDHVLRATLYWRNDTVVDTEDLAITVSRALNNMAPVALIDPANQTVEVGAEATFDGGRSYDPDGDDVTFLWDLGNGGTAQGQTAAHYYTDLGTYNVTLLVTDEHGATGRAYGLVEVVARDPPPGDARVRITDMETDKLTYEVGEVMEVTVVVTRGPDMLTFEWEGTLALERLDPDSAHEARWERPVNLPQGGATQTVTFTVEPAMAGPLVLVAKLYWMDGTFVDGRQLNVTVTQREANQAPVAVIDPARQSMGAADTARLDGSLSHDADGNITSHVWDMGDGTTLEGALVSHSYPGPGIYNVTLTVTDDDGATAVAYGVVEVLGFNPPPWEEAWIASVSARGSVNESEPFLVTVDVVRGDDMLDYVWLGTLVLEVVDVLTFRTVSQDVELATGGEARTHVFDLLLTEPGAYVIRATLIRQDGTVMDVEEARVTVGAVAGPDVPGGRALPDVPPSAVAAAGLLVTLAALGATEVGKTSLLGLLVPLYSKLRKGEILDQFTRGKIYGYILANPGDHYNAIQKALDIPNGTFAYHLQVLEKEGYIKSTREGMNRCFFPAGVKLPPQGGKLRAGQRMIIEKILEEPGLSQKDIARAIGVSPSTVSYHLRDLLEMGVVETERLGMRQKYYINRDLITTSV